MIITQFPLQIRFTDIDAMGIVNNAVYITYFEQARLMLFKEFSNQGWNWEEQGVIVVRNEADYLEPATLSDDLVIEIACSKIGNTSFTLDYTVKSVNNTSPSDKCKGRSVMVCFNHKTRQKFAVPEVWRVFLSQLH